jgi:hypothetical protein
MNGSDKIWVRGKGVKRGLRIVPDNGFYKVFQLIDCGRQNPGQLGFHGFPQPLDRIELWAIGRQEQTDNIGRDHQRFGLMATPIIHHHNIQAVPVVLGELIQKELKVDGIQMRQLQKKAVPGAGFDGAIQIEVLELVLHWPYRLYPAHRNASALHWEQAKATFILAKNSYRTLQCRWC